MNYPTNIETLRRAVESHAFVRNISQHRLSDGTLDIKGNLKLWNHGMEPFEKTPLWERSEEHTSELQSPR